MHLLGYRKDIPELNCSADVFCFPSFREGLSVSLIEVMACGLPVVCSRIRGNTDLITSDGGCLFDPYDVMDCWHAITSIRDGDMSRMSEVNIENSLCYSTNKIITEMKNIYEL